MDLPQFSVYQLVARSRRVFAVHRLVHFQWNQRPPKHPCFLQKGTFICLPSLSELSDIMIWAMSEPSTSFKRTKSHATTRVSSDIDVKRPENHQGIVSTRFNFNIPQEWPIAITVVETTLYTKWEKTFALFICYICHDAICRGNWLLPLNGALGRENTLYNREKICNSTWKRYLNHSYSCYEKVKNEKNL